MSTERPASTTPSTRPSVAASAASPALGPAAFRSERYGYALEVPSGWYVRGEGPGTWTPWEISYIGDGTDAFEEDYPGRGEVTNFPGITYGFYVSAAEAAKPTDVEEWTDRLAAVMNAASSCQGSPDRETITVAGESARALIYDRSDCTHDHHVIVVGVLHGWMGYNLMWLAKRGEDDDRRDTFESILETFRWVE